MCAPSFYPGFTSVNAESNSSLRLLRCSLAHLHKQKHYNLILPKVVFPCASICFSLSCCHTLAQHECFRVCACVLGRGYPSQTVPSASNSLVYLSLDRRAAAACPQVSELPALRTSWEEQGGRRSEGREGGRESASVFIWG